MVLLPVARAIASGEATPGSLLRLMARGSRVEVEVSPPESAENVPVEPSPSPRAASVFEQARRLRLQLSTLRERAAPMSSRKSNLLEMLAAPGAWDDRRAAEARSDEVFRIDGLLAALGRLDQELRRIEERLERRPSDRELARLEEQLDALEGRSRHAGVLVACRDPRDLGDTFIVLSRVGPKRGDMDGVGKLGRLYLKLAQRMNLEVAILDDHITIDPVEDMIVLQLTGAGAFALVVRERGLHYFIQGRTEGTDGRKGNQREVVRVEVFPLPGPDASLGREEVRAEVHALDDVEGRLMERPRFEVHLSHQPTMTTLRAWTDRSRVEAVEQLRPLLQARLAASSQEGPSGRVVRRYTLSPSPLVRDTLSGKSTGRLEEVLDGGLDQFFVTPVDNEVERVS
jgi:protein subunit release factor B